VDTHRHVLRFAAARASFEQASVAARTALDACGVRGPARYNAELVFEEVVSNVIRHGHASEITFSLTCEPATHVIVLTFEDAGPPFDPLAQPLPTLPKSLAEAPLGGLGLLLVRKASTHLRYQRTPAQTNLLTVTISTVTVNAADPSNTEAP
jgi:anti-sigma regulatory factor (Ser/Thr protein kinase)